MSCTVVVLSDNNLSSALAFTNAFREIVAGRSFLALIWYSISSRLNALPVRMLL